MATETPAPPPKFSRYRSVRHAASKTGPSSQEVPEMPQPVGMGSSKKNAPMPSTLSVDGNTKPNLEPARFNAQQFQVSPSGTDRQRTVHSKRKVTEAAEKSKPMEVLRQHYEERKLQSQQQDPKFQELPKFKSTKREDPLRMGIQVPKLPSTDRYGLFSRRQPNKNSETTVVSSHTDVRFKTVTKDMISAPIGIQSDGGGIKLGGAGIQPGGRGNVPGIDAPVSAVNAGERRVMVKCNKSSILLPVTPSTTPIDIIKSAAYVLPDKIETESSVLLESFKQLGLERPLRRYEHLRDVLNSWDQDDQNSILIVPSTTGGNDEDLCVEKVPAKAPGDVSTHMYYSQKPGSWDKRWFTLKEDGQVLMTKQNGSDAKYICHMRDFDIYIPTPRQISKKLKPPKKLCLAIKSQHKTSMFLSTANFVHFFSTKDKEVASAWYKAVQEWRSWYLVNVMGNGKLPPKPQEDSTQHANQQRQLQESNHHPHRPSHDSVEYTPHHIGSYGPVSSTHIGASVRSPPSQALPIPSLSHDNDTTSASGRINRIPGGPPTSFPQRLMKDANLGSSARREQKGGSREAQADPFEVTGLLGRTYSQRQKAQQRKEHPTTESQAPAPDAHAPEKNAPPPGERTMSMKAGMKEGMGVSRAGTQRQKPKPLIDLTPHYQELPQHVKKGRGVVPEQIPAGGLVDIATSPEVAIVVPRATTWRRPGTSGGREKP
ncbi:hypothetical protein MMC14_003902 [Varicellaria rhodocarpa]|nr:hypothetical protein [Varicellaria rhodocarpa]